jgi:hypothetical protein
VICYHPGDLTVGLSMAPHPPEIPDRDRPPADVAALAGQEFYCCPGFQWCPTTQSCIPQTVNCQDPVPV